MVEVKKDSKLKTNNNLVLAHQVEQVYYLNYPHPKLHGWSIVYKVNPHERFMLLGMLAMLTIRRAMMMSIRKKVSLKANLGKISKILQNSNFPCSIRI